jgi:two-component system, chemotaxis family, sensor kinase CheA
VEGFDTSGLVPEYLEDARGHLDKLDSVLLELEKDMGAEGPDVELVSDLLGSLHTLKGNSGMMGFVSLQQYVHQLEGVLKALLEGKFVLGDALLQMLFEAAAVLREALDQIEKDPKSHPDMSKETEKLADAGDGAGLSETPIGAKDTQKPRPSSAKSDSFKYIGAKSNILKVDFERLDHLLNLAGELVIHRTKLAEVDRVFKEAYPDKELSSQLSETAELIHKATSDLQEAIMKVRMLPISQVFHRFPRMVRDLSRDRGKEIELVFEGETTELDKTVIDEIGEPLLHLIRNSVDHGIESPDERIRQNKSQVGTIKLTAKQEGNHINIMVADDGAGIDVERIKNKAASRYSETELESLGRDNIIDLIFEPGFSTAKEVSEISGRGVGLDVVKKNVASLGGIVEVKSEIGKGTAFTIKLPLTLAIISSLMVGAGSETYALPLSSVVESLRFSSDELDSVNNREVIRLRDRVLPLVRLSSLFGNGGAPEEPARMYVVVVGRAEKRIGLVVDRLLGRQEIVIKSLGEFVGDAEGIAGATIMGDGRVVLILDISGLIDRNAIKADLRASRQVMQ